MDQKAAPASLDHGLELRASARSRFGGFRARGLKSWPAGSAQRPQYSLSGESTTAPDRAPQRPGCRQDAAPGVPGSVPGRRRANAASRCAPAATPSAAALDRTEPRSRAAASDVCTSQPRRADRVAAAPSRPSTQGAGPSERAEADAPGHLLLQRTVGDALDPPRPQRRASTPGPYPAPRWLATRARAANRSPYPGVEPGRGGRPPTHRCFAKGSSDAPIARVRARRASSLSLLLVDATGTQRLTWPALNAAHDLFGLPDKWTGRRRPR